MSLEQRWDLEDALDLVKQSYCYHTLPKRDFLSVMNYIGGKHPLEDRGVYGKVRYYPDEKLFGIRRGARIIYNLNIGTIPQEANYKVVILGTGYTVGSLFERFVEHLENKDVFILGGKTYEYIQARGMRVFVRDAQGRRPTVPSWTGEMLPRSFDLATEVGKFRTVLGNRLKSAIMSEDEIIKNLGTNTKNNTKNKTKIKTKNKAKNGRALTSNDKKINYSPSNLEGIENWLITDYYLDSGSARSIINYFIEQRSMLHELPTNNNLVIEGFIDSRGYNNVIFHYCFGRRVNDALARTYAHELSKMLRCTVRISLTDDNFMLTFSKSVVLKDIERLITAAS
jgi:ATP-dependent Lhr-like helicase